MACLYPPHLPTIYNAGRNKRFRGGFDPSLVLDYPASEGRACGRGQKNKEKDHGSSGSAKTHRGEGGTTMGPKAPGAGRGLEKHEVGSAQRDQQEFQSSLAAAWRSRTELPKHR